MHGLAWYFFEKKKRREAVRQKSCEKNEGHIRPSWRNSCTTCVLGTFPAAPPPTRKFSREAAKARAALHAKVEAHLNLQACSALPLRMDGSDRALALANWHTNDRVSSDPAKTTNLPRELHRPCEQHHASQSLVSWACGTAKSMSLTIMLRVTRPPASRQTLAPALSTANPRRPNTPALEHAGTMVNKRIQGTATSAQTERERERRRRRRRRTRNKAESMRVRKPAGATESAIPE